MPIIEYIEFDVAPLPLSTEAQEVEGSVEGTEATQMGASDTLSAPDMRRT